MLVAAGVSVGRVEETEVDGVEEATVGLLATPPMPPVELLTEGEAGLGARIIGHDFPNKAGTACLVPRTLPAPGQHPARRRGGPLGLD